MDTPAPELEERHSSILGELAEMQMVLARKLQARALEAESVQEAERLAGAFAKCARGVRQTLALEMRLARLRKQAEREDPDYAAKARHAQERAQARIKRVDAQKKELGDWIGPAIWNEYEHERGEARALLRRFDEWLETAAERDDFTLASQVEPLLKDACAFLGLDYEALMAWHEAEDEDDDEDAGSLLPRRISDTG